MSNKNDEPFDQGSDPDDLYSEGRPPDASEYADGSPASVHRAENPQEMAESAAVSRENEEKGFPPIDPSLVGGPPEVPFPPDVLPPDVEEPLRRAARASAAPFCFVVMTFLATVGMLIARSRIGLASSGWKIPTVLWVLLVGEPSANKSPGLEAGIGPYRQLQKEVRAKARQLMREQRENEMDKGPARLAREQMERRLGECGWFLPKSQIEMKPADIIQPMLLASVRTVPGLEDVLKQDPGGFISVDDEIGRRLDQRDPMRSTLLEGYNGGCYSRVVGGKQVEFDRFLIGLVGGIQPDVLAKRVKSLAEDGMAARFFPVYGGPVAVPSKMTAADDTVLGDYLRSLYDLGPSSDEDGAKPCEVLFSPDAEEEIRKAWERGRALQASQSGALAGIAGKSHGSIARLAIVLAFLHSISDGKTEPDYVGVEDVRRAAALFETFIWPHAVAVFGEASLPAELRAARRVVRILKRLDQEFVTLRDIYRHGGDEFRSVDDLWLPVGVLERLDVLRMVPSVPGPSGGRSTLRFHVHPDLLSRSRGAAV